MHNNPTKYLIKNADNQKIYLFRTLPPTTITTVSKNVDRADAAVCATLLFFITLWGKPHFFNLNPAK